MEAIIKAIIEHLGVNGVWVVIVGALLYFGRKDSKEHREEYKQISKQMLSAFTANTESNTRLSESIADLKDRVK